MKNTLYVMLAMFVVGAVGGCSTDSTGTLQLTWTLTQNGADVSCAAGDQVWVTSTSGGSQFVDKFNCTDLAGEVSLRPASYSVLVELRDASDLLVVPGGTVTAVIEANRVTDVGVVEFDLGDAGTISGTWQMTKNGALTTCAAVTAATVKIRSTPLGGSTAYVDTFTCSDGGGTTDPLPAGTYNVKVDLLNSSGQSLTLFTVQGTVNVSAGGDSQLNNIVFAF